MWGQAAAIPMCFLSAFSALYKSVKPGVISSAARQSRSRWPSSLAPLMSLTTSAMTLELKFLDSLSSMQPIARRDSSKQQLDRARSWPRKNDLLVQTESPVDSIRAERGAKNVNVNLLRYFSQPEILDGEAKAFLQLGMSLSMKWAEQGWVVPHIGKTINSSVDEINAGLQSLKSGGTLGKVAVIVDRHLEEVNEGGQSLAK